MIDDPVDFKYDENEDDGNNNPVLRTPLPGENDSNQVAATPQSKGKNQSKLARKEKGIGSILEKMNQGREDMNNAVKEIVGIIRRASDIRSTSGLLGGKPYEMGLNKCTLFEIVVFKLKFFCFHV
jgi:hypothetical protein